MPIRIPLMDRVRIDEKTGCWNWPGYKLGNGYGLMCYGKKYVMVHRVAAHIWLRMPLEKKYCALHKCNNKACWNPKHLYIGDRSQNAFDCVRAGTHYQARKTHCPKGHPLSGDNLDPWSLRRNRRKCLTCERHRGRLRNKNLDKYRHSVANS